MIVILLVGVAVSYLAGEIARGSAPGLMGAAAVGIVGALIGNWLAAAFALAFAAPADWRGWSRTLLFRQTLLLFTFSRRRANAEAVGNREHFAESVCASFAPSLGSRAA
jgi:uncharacterized membrane protein YeaQ/YmgE (transglycosylase-associated protein family)